MKGPDTIGSTENITTWLADGTCKIRNLDDDTGSIKPMSLVTAIRNTCESPDAMNLTALKVKRDGKWITWNYAEYYNDIKCLSRAFINLGLTARHAVAILGFNSPEWFLSEMACIFAGGMVNNNNIFCSNTCNSVSWYK